MGDFNLKSYERAKFIYTSSGTIFNDISELFTVSVKKERW